MLAQEQTRSISQPGVSEILIPAWEQTSIDLVLPMLAHLSHQAGNRWLTWISPTGLSKAKVEEFEFNTGNVRLIHSHNDAETLWAMWDALSLGTSAFVVGSFFDGQSVQQNERQQLENACLNGDARGLVLKLPTH